MVGSAHPTFASEWDKGRCLPYSSPRSLPIQRLVNPCHLLHPALARSVLQAHDLVMGPVEVVGQVGYLLKEAL